MKKILLFVLPSLLFAEISNDLFRDCSNAKYSSCAKIGDMYMNINSPDYNPSSGLDYLNSACISSVPSACYSLARYYDSKGDNQRSLSFYKKSCDLKNSIGCYYYHQKRGD